MKLSLAKLNAKVKIVSFLNNKIQKKRLFDMGITEGVVIKIIRKGFFASPIEILVRGTHVAIRKIEAEKIIVEEV